MIPDHYVFKNPFASSIYPTLNFNETLSILQEINSSQPAQKRFPIEILLLINEEVHTGGNILIKRIRDAWTPFKNDLIKACFRMEQPIRLRLNLEEKKYYLQEALTPNSEDNARNSAHRFKPSLNDTLIEQIHYHISTADLLYRLRCCFPEVAVNADQTMAGCEMYIKHNQSQLLLQFRDYHGGVSASAVYQRVSAYQYANRIQKQTLFHAFAVDVQLLLSMLHETVGGTRRLAYYHPAAIADLAIDNEQGYIAVPYTIRRNPQYNEPTSIYSAWKPTKVSAADISSFQSILRDLKYDIPSRTVDRLNGTTDLTAVISSALLFYRLSWKFMRGRLPKNVNTIPPITSIWQAQLTHFSTEHSIIFMDDRGLFDIRASVGINEAMGDVEALVEALCGDTCTHPLDGTVAGCVA